MKQIIRIVSAPADKWLVKTARHIAQRVPHIFLVGECFEEADLLGTVKRKQPDVLLLDCATPDCEPLRLLRALRELPIAHRPMIVLFLDALPHDAVTECRRLGASFVLRRQSEPELLIDLINQYAAASRPAEPYVWQPEMEDAHMCVSRLLRCYAIPPHLMGYRYLRECVIAVMENEELASFITKVLYPKIARRHRTAWTNVERDIRSAIALAWERSGREGSEMRGMKRRPSNRQLILELAERANLEMRWNRARWESWKRDDMRWQEVRKNSSPKL